MFTCNPKEWCASMAAYVLKTRFQEKIDVAKVMMICTLLFSVVAFIMSFIAISRSTNIQLSKPIIFQGQEYFRITN